MEDCDYDTFYVNCPKCNTELEFTSYDGCCSLNDYYIYNVPHEIALGLNGATQKCICGTKIELKSKVILTVNVKE